jgi:hypothetical protein
MNDRIKFLIAEAEIFANKTVPQLKGNETYWWHVRDEKFAELLIKECIAQCNDGDSRYFIATHFGVKE